MLESSKFEESNGIIFIRWDSSKDPDSWAELIFFKNKPYKSSFRGTNIPIDTYVYFYKIEPYFILLKLNSLMNPQLNIELNLDF